MKNPVTISLTIFNENTSVRNQTIRVLSITTYTALLLYYAQQDAKPENKVL
jgi:hypothetical protein